MFLVNTPVFLGELGAVGFVQDPVVRMAINANLRLKLNRGFISSSRSLQMLLTAYFNRMVKKSLIQN